MRGPNVRARWSSAAGSRTPICPAPLALSGASGGSLGFTTHDDLCRVASRFYAAGPDATTFQPGAEPLEAGCGRIRDPTAVTFSSPSPLYWWLTGEGRREVKRNRKARIQIGVGLLLA